jgi:uncharacterized membrane protein AbrB (regulator of aidB expression)
MTRNISRITILVYLESVIIRRLSHPSTALIAFFMASDHSKTVPLTLPSATLLILSQAAIGCGIGILVADKIGEKKKTPAVVALLSIAIATTIPAVVGIVADLINGPQSKLGVRRRLRSIREDSGLHAEEEVF